LFTGKNGSDLVMFTRLKGSDFKIVHDIENLSFWESSWYKKIIHQVK
jgi:hypothetical protein